MTKDELIAFEKEVADTYLAGEIRGPVHLSGGNEDELIEIFREVKAEDWVLSTHRSHYHALLKGVPRDWLMGEIMAGRSMGIYHEGHRFFSSSIVGGVIPIAVGIGIGIKRKGSREQVWCFIGDMASMTGAFSEGRRYVVGHELPVRFVVEDNGVSVNTPTIEAWGVVGYDRALPSWEVTRYRYEREWPHIGCGKWVVFG